VAKNYNIDGGFVGDAAKLLVIRRVHPVSVVWTKKG